jgi:hypothetical protein
MSNAAMSQTPLLFTMERPTVGVQVFAIDRKDNAFEPAGHFAQLCGPTEPLT